MQKKRRLPHDRNPVRKRIQSRKRLIEEFAETLQVEAHKLGSHGMSEKDFYNLVFFGGHRANSRRGSRNDA